MIRLHGNATAYLYKAQCMNNYWEKFYADQIIPISSNGKVKAGS